MSRTSIHQSVEDIDLDLDVGDDGGGSPPDDPRDAWTAFVEAMRAHQAGEGQWTVVRAAYGELRALLTADDLAELWKISKAAAKEPDHDHSPLHEYGRLRDREYQMTPMYLEAQRRKDKRRTGTPMRRKSANAAQKRYKLKKRAERLAAKMKEETHA